MCRLCPCSSVDDGPRPQLKARARLTSMSLQERLQAHCGLSPQSVALASGFLFSSNSQPLAGFGVGYSICVPEVRCSLAAYASLAGGCGRHLLHHHACRLYGLLIYPATACLQASVKQPSGRPCAMMQDCNPCEIETAKEPTYSVSWPVFDVSAPFIPPSYWSSMCCMATNTGWRTSCVLQIQTYMPDGMHPCPTPSASTDA